MSPVLQELRKSMGKLAARDVDHRGRRGNAARCRYLLKPPSNPVCKHDDPVAIPCSAPAVRCIGYDLRDGARYFQFLQFSAGEESDKSAVLGPEWERRI